MATATTLELKYLKAMEDLVMVWNYPLTIAYKVYGHVGSSMLPEDLFQEVDDTLTSLQRKQFVKHRFENTLDEATGITHRRVQYRLTDSARVYLETK